jgi:sulfur relay (sulfurtransferase) DsrC/TusE family protein
MSLPASFPVVLVLQALQMRRQVAQHLRVLVFQRSFHQEASASVLVRPLVRAMDLV